MHFGELHPEDHAAELKMFCKLFSNPHLHTLFLAGRAVNLRADPTAPAERSTLKGRWSTRQTTGCQLSWHFDKDPPERGQQLSHGPYRDVVRC